MSGKDFSHDFSQEEIIEIFDGGWEMNKGRPLTIIYIGIQNVNTKKFNAERSFFCSIHSLMILLSAC